MEIKIGDIKSIPTTFMLTAKSRKDKIAMRHKKFGLWQEITWSEYYHQSSFLAHSLINLGVESGDFVGIIGENCPEWLYMDMGIQMAGAKTVGIYTTNSWQQLHYIMEHSECKILFAENEEQIDKWLQIKGDLPNLKYVIYWEKKGLEKISDPQLLLYENVIKDGQLSFNENPNLHIDRLGKVSPDDTALLVYTSGTTGKPKAAMLSAKNIFWVTENLKINGEDLISENDQTMSFLPLCHIFERLFSVYLPITLGYVICFAESTDTIAQNIREIRPTVGYGVPRVWEKFQSSMILKMQEAPRLNQFLFKKAVNSGYNFTTKKLANEPISLMLRAKRFIAYWTILYPLKYMMGMNRMSVALSGAAPISREVLKFYHMLGIPLIEGYGMTETSAIISVSTLKDFKLGTVGKLMEGAEIKLAEDGEILVKHPGVIKGYYKNQVATSELFRDGWMCTGDVGILDEDGYLQIVDRKKDLIITAGGKNIAPQKIENILKSSVYINDAIVIGDMRKYLTAIIILDEENIFKFASDKKIQYSTYSDLTNHPEIRTLIEKYVSDLNKVVSRVENIRKFTILDKRLYVEDGEVTPTMKVKRSFINSQYQDLIKKMYI